MAGPASAAVAILDSITPVSDGFRFEYRITLGPDEGLRAGDRLVIFDFAGYVNGSIFGPDATDLSTEFLSLPFITPGETDDASLVNLVWTYNGPDFRVDDGPYPAISQVGFGAVSRYGQTVLDAFTSETTKNNPADSAGTPLVQGGFTQVPAIPEPASWALMIAGFGLVGVSMRRRRNGFRSLAQ
jgi:PEP-CTERM motif